MLFHGIHKYAMLEEKTKVPEARYQWTFPHRTYKLCTLAILVKEKCFSTARPRWECSRMPITMENSLQVASLTHYLLTPNWSMSRASPKHLCSLGSTYMYHSESGLTGHRIEPSSFNQLNIFFIRIQIYLATWLVFYAMLKNVLPCKL